MSAEFDKYLKNQIVREDTVDISTDDNSDIDGFFDFDDDSLCKKMLSTPIFDGETNELVDDGSPDLEFDKLINQKSLEER